MHGLEPLEGADGMTEHPVRSRVRDDDQPGIVTPAVLVQGLDRHTLISEQAGHAREHARLVCHVEHDVVASVRSLPSAPGRSRRTSTLPGR